MSRRLRRAAAAAGAALLVGGCGSVSRPPPTASVSLAMLPARAVSLPNTVKPLSPAGLAREVSIPGLAARLHAWGFVAGRDRYFQGESRVLQVVDSRTLRFRTPAGAAAYVSYMRSHVSPILGTFPAVRPFTSAGREGFVATAQECQCHLANPAYLAAVAGGRTVAWLEINGPRATPRLLARLIAQAP